MKRTIILTVLLFTLSLVGYAQEKKNVVFLHKTETMNELGLDTEQQTKITALTKASFAEITKIKKNTELTESQRKTQISSVYRQRQKDYEAALTPQQLKKYNEMKEAAKNNK
ncbi:hypothetical protein [Sphingobacterium paucimobilis]|uniref:DUF4890 domain-containing protein n=1 Tax=Sphingobacterium paucimobilis HER1398 TaxID=1346330 RepID=U2J8F2_9SPHI|nr:hypothetical protein [Sphingobacterium paucimobilis]ERJ58948.1 hypothetical protein M472_09205 [Sphingobacterium paucimobilis HER1398]